MDRVRHRPSRLTGRPAAVPSSAVQGLPPLRMPISMSVPGTAADIPISCSGAISTVPGTGPRAWNQFEDGAPAPSGWKGELSTFNLQRVTVWAGDFIAP